ncbi:MAG: ABC transporter ATP-binding protein [Clostridia bacterium]|nr:ABC transporter ATP-binding protein [Clostridia bacterium]
MCIAGIVLLLLAFLIRKLVSRVLISQRKEAGIQEDADTLLRVEHLKQYFKSGSSVTKAVDDISFYIKRGEVFGLVGESGCGKTTTGRTIINLYDPTEGDVYFDGLRISSTQNGLPVLKAQLKQDYGAKIEEAKKRGAQDEVHRLKKELQSKLRTAEDNALESSVEKSKCVDFYREKRLKELKEAYEKDIKTLSGEALDERTRRYETERKVAAKDNVMTRMQMIFQDPIASINPRMTVREIIAEGLIIRGVTDKEYINQKVYEMLELVGLVREHADRYPHEFSGGQRQRIGIARAIIMEPDLIIADEPISALDVSIQAQVINLLNDLRERMGLTIMFIAHNLSVVKYFSDRIAVMYFGHIVEMAPSDELFAHPLHPYTKSLLSAIPYPDPHYEKTRQRIEYNPAKAHDYSVDKPELREIVPGHYIHCNDAEYARYLEEIRS